MALNLSLGTGNIGGGGDKPEQSKSVTITENGSSTILPDSGKTLSSVNVTTAVPIKEEQTKSASYAENGNYTISPDSGKVLSGVNISVNVPQKEEETKSVTITENGTQTITPTSGKTLSSVEVITNVSGGGGGGNIAKSIWKSTNGGSNWTKLSVTYKASENKFDCMGDMGIGHYVVIVTDENAPSADYSNVLCSNYCERASSFVFHMYSKFDDGTRTAIVDIIL